MGRDNARYNKMRMGRGRRLAPPPISNDQVIIGNTNIESSDPRDDVTDQPKKLSETEINTLASNKAKRDQMLNMREHMKVAQQDETFYNDAILRNQQQKLKVEEKVMFDELGYDEDQIAEYKLKEKARFRPTNKKYDPSSKNTDPRNSITTYDRAMSLASQNAYEGHNQRVGDRLEKEHQQKKIQETMRDIIKCEWEEEKEHQQKKTQETMRGIIKCEWEDEKEHQQKKIQETMRDTIKCEWEEEKEHQQKKIQETMRDIIKCEWEEE